MQLQHIYCASCCINRGVCAARCDKRSQEIELVSRALKAKIQQKYIHTWSCVKRILSPRPNWTAQEYEMKSATLIQEENTNTPSPKENKASRRTRVETANFFKWSSSSTTRGRGQLLVGFTGIDEDYVRNMRDKQDRMGDQITSASSVERLCNNEKPNTLTEEN